MKILYVSTNREHTNDEHINNIYAFLEIAQIDFYGPGYSTKEELKNGMKYYWSKEGGYDCLILDFDVAMMQGEYLNIGEAYAWHRYYMSDYNIHEAIRWADNIVNEAKSMDVPKIVHFCHDTINITEVGTNCLQELLDKGFYIWCLGAEHVPKVIETEHSVSINWTNRYYYFCKQCENKMISMCWSSVTPREYFGLPLEKRKYDITVPGNLDKNYYPLRQEIVDRISRENYKIYNEYYDRELAYRNSDSKFNNTVYKCEEDKLVDKKLRRKCVYLDARVSRDSIAVWRERYNVALRKSKMGYADGGFCYQIVRKFLEIPARGTVLLCEDIPPLKCYGFKEWENMVTVKPENVVEICAYLLKHPKEMQSIASAGRKMVFEKHTSLHHAKHILDSIEAIKAGTFRGSYWEDGEFIIRTN